MILTLTTNVNVNVTYNVDVKWILQSWSKFRPANYISMIDESYVMYMITFILFVYQHFRITAVRPIISAMDGRPQVLSVSFHGGFVLEGMFNAIICALHSRIIDAVEASFKEDAAAAAASAGIAQSNAIAAWAWVHDYVSWILRLRSEMPLMQASKKTPLTARSQSLGSDQFWTSANTRTGLGLLFSLSCIFNFFKL